MPSITPSIQSFFPLSSSPAPVSSPPAVGDGFTAAEVANAISKSPPTDWTPTMDYQHLEICQLIPGSHATKFTGFIANINDSTHSSRSHRAAKGSIRMIVVDGTGKIGVKLCYSKFEYRLKLGQVVTIFTSRVSSDDSGGMLTASALSVNLFPEREKTSHVAVHGDSNQIAQSKHQLSIDYSQQKKSLMTLKSFTDGGWEVTDARIIVIVKSIGARRKVTSRDGTMSNMVTVKVSDNSEEASLSLWGVTASSAAEWRPGHTVLLVTNPGYNNTRQKWLSLPASSLVDVNPDIRDAAWLRNYAQGLSRKQHVNPPFPSNLTVEDITNASVRTLYTLAEVDERAREVPDESFSGYINVNIAELKMFSLYQRKMLFCVECCGVPLFANTMVARCKQCEEMVELRVNPQMVGLLVDETGCISSGKVILSDQAWSQLMGRDVHEMVSSRAYMKAFERRVQHSRVTMIFYWSVAVGRFVILQVSMCDNQWVVSLTE